MSTPTRESAERRVRAGRATELFARWIEESLERLREVEGVMPRGDVYDHMAGQIAAVERMLEGLRGETRMQADLWGRLGDFELQQRRTARELRATDVAEVGRWTWEGEPDGPPFTPGTYRHEAFGSTDSLWDVIRTIARTPAFGAPPYPAALQREARELLEEREAEEPGAEAALDEVPPGRFDLDERAIAELPVVDELPDWLRLATKVDDPASAEQAARDAVEFGVGYLVDGKRVAPQLVRVFVHRGEEVVEEGPGGA